MLEESKVSLEFVGGYRNIDSEAMCSCVYKGVNVKILGDTRKV